MKSEIKLGANLQNVDMTVTLTATVYEWRIIMKALEVSQRTQEGYHYAASKFSELLYRTLKGLEVAVESVQKIEGED